MKNMRLVFPAAAAALVAAALPLAAQSPDSMMTAHPPLWHIVTPAGSSPTGFTPVMMKVAYGFRQVRDEGKGQTIAIIDAFDDPQAEADLATFDTQYDLPACTTANGCFKVLYGSGTKPPSDSSGWSDEVAIDTQWAHSIAPGANILLVEAKSNSFADLLKAVDTAVANGATVVSMSWSGGESSNELTWDTHFNVVGVTFVAAAGDAGSGAAYPAASPYVVGVGGTTLTVNSNSTWAGEVAWAASGGGVSTVEPEPSYQSAVQSTGFRGVPDVAYDGDPNTGVPSYSSHPCGGCYTGWNQWGGTSIGTPQWAALFAIVNSVRVQNGKALLTQPQVDLYPDAEKYFHDVTSGSNGGCGVDCNAGPGYDFVTGLGSPKAAGLMRKLFAQ